MSMSPYEAKDGLFEIAKAIRESRCVHQWTLPERRNLTGSVTLPFYCVTQTCKKCNKFRVVAEIENKRE